MGTKWGHDLKVGKACCRPNVDTIDEIPWRFRPVLMFYVQLSSPTPGLRHLEPCLATAQGLTRRPATTKSTPPAPEQMDTDRIEPYPGTAPPAKSPIRTTMGSIHRSTTLTTPGTQRPSMAVEATRGTSMDGGQRRWASFLGQQTTHLVTDTPVAPVPPWVGVVARP